LQNKSRDVPKNFACSAGLCFLVICTPEVAEIDDMKGMYIATSATLVENREKKAACFAGHTAFYEGIDYDNHAGAGIKNFTIICQTIKHARDMEQFWVLPYVAGLCYNICGMN